MNQKNIFLGFLIFTLFFIFFETRCYANESVNDFIDFININSSIEVSESTIVPYHQIVEEGNKLEVVSTIYSRDSWVNEVIELGMTKIGCEYSQAQREHPKKYDCSSFVRRMYEEVTGVYIGGTSSNIANNLKKYEISFDELQPGDLMWLEGHIAMYIGEGEIIHSTSAKGKNGVCVEPAFGRIKFTKAFRAIDYIRDLIA